MGDGRLKELLDRAAEAIHTPEFVNDDPVQFARRFSKKADCEVVALLTAHLAWGNRKMICRDCERLLGMMDGEPARWVREGEFRGVADGVNIHRTFFGRNLKHFCGGLQRVLQKHGTVDDFCASNHCGDAWQLAAALNRQMEEASGMTDARCLPLNLDHTALKRLNMALRWLVRKDGDVVDMGLWESLNSGQLYIPLDVHVGNTSRALGLTRRKGNDRKTCEEITGALRKMRPHDPVYYDFALFGLGVSQAVARP